MAADNTFRKATDLHTIKIMNQSIYALNTYTFTGLKKLKESDLRNNPIKVIGSNVFYNNRFKKNGWW